MQRKIGWLPCVVVSALLIVPGCGKKPETATAASGQTATGKGDGAEAVRQAEEQAAQLEAQKKVQMVASAKELQAVYSHWKDIVAVAGSTPRIALSQPIQSLQDVRRQAEGFQPTFCLGQAKEELVTAMQIKIDDFIAFMGQQEGMRTIKQINGDLPKADDHFATFEQLLNDGLNGASSCMNAG